MDQDPYRTPSDYDPLDHLRRTLRLALSTLGERLHVLPPSQVEHLSRCLAAFADPAPEDAIQLLEALEALAGQDPRGGPALVCSELWPVEDQIPAAPSYADRFPDRIIGPGHGTMFLPRAMKVEVHGDPTPPQFAIYAEGREIVERCSAAEFSSMTRHEFSVLTSTRPMFVGLWRSPAATAPQWARVILRGETPSMNYSPYAMPGGMSRAIASKIGHPLR